jgi:hypothetical protein
MQDIPGGQRFNITDTPRAAFERLKDVFTSDILLAHFELDLKAILECDISN